MKVYSVRGGPPSLAVRQTLKCLNIPFQLIDVNFNAGDHLTEEFTKLNPQREIPVLDDDGFLLGESNSIMQYICDQHRPDSNLYPKDPKVRAIVNQRLCFNLSTYYRHIGEYTVGTIFFDYERTPLGLKKVHIALEVFETFLKTLGKKYAAADYLTIADFPLVTSTMCLEAIEFDFSTYKLISQWYATFKKEYPELWDVAMEGIEELSACEKDRPDLSQLNHPIHPTRKTKN